MDSGPFSVEETDDTKHCGTDGCGSFPIKELEATGQDGQVAGASWVVVDPYSCPVVGLGRKGEKHFMEKCIEV